VSEEAVKQQTTN